MTLACATAAALGFCLPASAADPDFSFVLPAGSACANFDLQIDGWGGKRHFHEFTDANGNVVRTLDTGTGFALRFTNLANGNLLSTRSNGSVTQRYYNADGSYTEVDNGHTVLILFPTDDPPGPSTTLIVGRLVFTVDLLGTFGVQSVSGNETDICAALS
jgi:hypothetical protein